MNQNIIEILINAKDQASSILQRNADALKKTGQELLGISAAIGAALVLTTSAALNFENSIANTASVLQLTAQQSAALNDELLGLGAQARAGPQAVADAFYDIAGGVADASTHMAILDAAIATSEAGNAQLTATTNALVGVMNAYRFSADEAGFASDVLTQIVAKGVGRMDQFASALPNVTALASNLGVEFDELGAIMARLTQSGLSANESATRLNAIMSALINPNEKLKEAMAAAGIQSGQWAIQNWGLYGALEAIDSASMNVGMGLAEVLGSSEATAAAMALLKGNTDQVIDSFRATLDGATELARGIQMASPAAQFDLLMSSVQALRIEAGQAFIPVLLGLFEAIRPIISALFVWMQQNPEVATGISGLLAAVAAIGPAMIFAGQATNFLNLASTALTGPWGLIIKLVGILALAIATNFGGIRDFIVENFFPVIQGIGTLFGALWNALRPLLQALWNLFSGVFGTILELLKPFIDTLSFVIKMVASLVQFLTGDLVGAFQTFNDAMGRNSAIRTMGGDALARKQQFFNQQMAGTGQMPGNTFNGQGVVPTFNSGTGQVSSSTINVNVPLPPGVAGNPYAAQSAGRDFGQEIALELQRQGI
jgi:TP901 family phage tail tape measure protein